MFVSHKVGEQGNVVPFFQEILGEPVAERMRINNGLLETVLVIAETDNIRAYLIRDKRLIAAC